MVLLAFSCRNSSNIYEIPSVKYPSTKKVDVSDNYFGTVVPDSFRWLENDTAKDVEQWVIEQNKVTFGFLGKIPFRDKIKGRLEEIYKYTRVTSPLKSGNIICTIKMTGCKTSQ